MYWILDLIKNSKILKLGIMSIESWLWMPPSSKLILN